jgi:monofunctional biosynthetic peptidoglycan transglycosylase
MSRPPLKKRLLKLLAFLLLAPYALTVIYLFVPPPSTLMLADLAAFTLPRRDWAPLEKIAPSLAASVIAAEDGAFCSHFGFDFAQLEKSIDQAAEGGKLRGASTISQQTAKNLFLWNGRSWLRKALEAPLTVWMEIILPKRRILEIYLNVAQWGDGIYGIEAASQHYFGTSAATLSIYQAALLASALPNPKLLSPINPGPAQLAQATIIRRRAQSHGPDLSCLK